MTVSATAKAAHPSLSPLDKGVPGTISEVTIEAVADQRWSLLREDIPLPAAVIKQDALRHNREWMKSFLEDSGMALAPHGKTTMCPALFDMQLDDGAWAITVATAHQLQVARAFGYSRIFFANQLIGKSAIDYVMRELANDPAFEFFCLVDDLSNVEALASAARAATLGRPMKVLVELGYVGGRTGCRTVEQAMTLARAVHASGTLALAGIEGFEGLIRGSSNTETLAQVESLLGTMVELAERCASQQLFAEGTVLLSAGGSSFFDVVATRLSAARLDRKTRILLRSGCYITHDSVLYVRAMDAMRERNSTLADSHGGLEPALEVWAYVQSRPEAEKAIVGFGKRDISYDDLPVALSWYRPDGGMTAPQPVPAGYVVTRLNDQHCHLSLPASSPLRVGDLIGFGISHPCLTFDKWRVIHLVDPSYRVTGSIRTYF
ncbi:amino acid deaminase [Mesorhizobium sp. B3-1-9]|uniref:amino acid deaminase n=1 Tax=Mesorhizobium sp. B3-1-9 TaxID=2589892 RepID=UPI001127F2B0|nr:amino acid deaminase [Mesorhizobium sp. B3-1-9]TPI38088.1 amino acid deaminase [Mesorhizobium sp. B3-1-9]